MIRVEEFEIGYTFWGQDVSLLEACVDFEEKTVMFNTPHFSTYKKNRIYQMPFPYMKKPDYDSFVRFMVARTPFELETFESSFDEMMRKNGEENPLPYKYAMRKGLTDVSDTECSWKKVLTSLPPESLDETILASVFDMLSLTEGRKRYYEDNPGSDVYREIISNTAYNDLGTSNRKITDIMYLRPALVHTSSANAVTEVIGNARAALLYGKSIAGSNGFKEDSIRLTWFPDYDPVNHWVKIRRKMNYISAFRELRYVYMGRLDVAERLIKDGKFTEEELLDTLKEEITLLPLKLKRGQLKRFRQCFVNC